MNFKINSEITLSNKILLKETKYKMIKNHFAVCRNQNAIIIYGNTLLFDKIEADVQLYYNFKEFLEKIVITIFPPNYRYIQSFLIQEYGEPSIIKENENVCWEIDDCRISHCVMDHFGDIEMISAEWIDEK